MTDRDLFDEAVFYARRRAYLRALANDPQRERRTQWTRRQCLRGAREAERRVFNLSIRAEQRCLREVDQRAQAPVSLALLLHSELIGTIPTTQEASDALMALLTTGPDGAPL